MAGYAARPRTKPELSTVELGRPAMPPDHQTGRPTADMPSSDEAAVWRRPRPAADPVNADLEAVARQRVELARLIWVRRVQTARDVEVRSHAGQPPINPALLGEIGGVASRTAADSDNQP